MLNFIVLGQVPGTNFQINFQGALIIALTLLVIAEVAFHLKHAKKVALSTVPQMATIQLSKLAR